MIHHVDAALTAWFAELDPSPTVTFDDEAGAGDSGARGGKKRTASMSLRLAGLREQSSKRNTEESDVRDQAGRVVARQRAIRWFELDYRCDVSGPHPVAHETLGALLQLLVDHDTVPDEHLPGPIREIGEPVEIELATPGAAVGGVVVIRVVVPVQPTAEREIAPPAVELHLEMAPAPGAEPATGGADQDQDGASAPASDPMAEKRWTTVRRRERITPEPTPS